MKSDAVPDQYVGSAPGSRPGSIDRASRASRSLSARPCGRCTRVWRRRSGNARPPCSRSCRPSTLVRNLARAPASPEFVLGTPKFWLAAESATARPRPRKRSRPRAQPRRTYLRPGLCLPDLDRFLVPLDGTPGWLLPPPAVPFQLRIPNGKLPCRLPFPGGSVRPRMPAEARLLARPLPRRPTGR